MRMFAKALTFLSGMLVFSVACAAGDPQRGLEISGVCVACHNVDGNSTVQEWPKIAGQGEAYLYKQLVDFRSGDKGGRNNPIMFGIVGQMSDQDLADLAAYFSQQQMTLDEADPALVELGEQIYRGGLLEKGVTACIACHGPSGDGNKLAQFPRVAGQMAGYMTEQLKAFADGRRTNGPNDIMTSIAHRMTEAEMLAVSSYMAGLRSKAEDSSTAE